MATELLKKKTKSAAAKPEAAEAAAAKKATKATKTTKIAPKAEKRKASEDASPVAVKKHKPSKDAVSDKKAGASVEEKATTKKSALKKERKSSKAKADDKNLKKAAESEQPQNGDVPSDDDEEEVDDETKALVQSLDSGDEDDAENQISTYKKGQDVGKIPKPKKPTKSSGSTEQRGVMYLARLPHGFYEHELREYFGQFGEVTRLRVVRNKKTGASRHRAFIEFADAEVADIAARTMDKYLLFGHILTAKIVPPSQVHPNLFKGANRRFKVVPWNKMAGRQLERPLSESQWQIKISKEEQRRAARAEKLKELGYEFEGPKLKTAEAKPLLENGTSGEPKAIEAPPSTEQADSKDKEDAKQAEDAQEARAKETERTQEAAPQKKKAKKGKKTKS
ncbi:hypothetical protein VTK56DRAFT_7068 [Thermocarpiscus australiensis]